ncbi:sensor domain-containing protein [Catellatospora sp. KI3]|uniref:sensor histidine kinase n=1 Tax=Catellatospora sp. KI3 TaxID=3041620 RepID=UPI002482310D|nr:sensor domain-containing protein [Catellatospora sp. KI3]MDI1462658.1 sensor domain-containing protein [Catellatospora sp. KI3]
MPVDQYLLPALRRRRYLRSAWPWRAAAYLATTVAVAAVVAPGVLLTALTWIATGRRLVDGAPLRGIDIAAPLVCTVLAVLIAPLLSVPLAVAERWRLGMVDDRPVASAHRPAADPLAWLRLRYTEAATWRETLYAVLLGSLVPLVYGAVALLLLIEAAFLTGPFLIPQGAGPIALGTTTVHTPQQAVPYALLALALLPVVPYLLGLLAAGQAALARALLGAAPGDATALREVARSRARLMTAYEAERRRIERDLHDGVQHRLTSLTLQLSLARLDTADDSPAAAPLTRAHEQAKELMTVLRDLIHGIAPQTLRDLGLPAALRELADRSPLPVAVTVAAVAAGRLPDLVESTAYFAASEALANTAKHAGATRADVVVTRTGDLLVLEVRDDGRGGADPARGSGLSGLADRVATVRGRLLLASPAGGPTLVRVELPCTP